MKRRILITGGAGFIGSNIADTFVEAGWDVAVLDDLSSGRRENVPRGARFYEADVRSKEAQAAVEQEKPHVLCHHAAQIDVRRSMADPRYDCDVNLGGLLNVMVAATRSGVEQILFASSGGAMYGDTDVIPTPEEHPTRAISHYGVAKAASELYLHVFRHQNKLRAACLRYGNVYGPRQDPHGEAGVVAIFSQRLLAGAPCTIFGDGKQTRDFVYVRDVARANLLAAEKGYDGSVNVGTAVETDVNKLYGILAAAAGVKIPATFAPARPGEQQRSCLDPSKAMRELGWKPQVHVEEGLPMTLEWFRGRKAA